MQDQIKILKCREMKPTLKNILKIILPCIVYQDKHCDYITELGRCRLQDNKNGRFFSMVGVEELDYNPCNSSNHNECKVYLDSKEDYLWINESSDF